jgi:hypothetical protein
MTETDPFEQNRKALEVLDLTDMDAVNDYANQPLTQMITDLEQLQFEQLPAAQQQKKLRIDQLGLAEYRHQLHGLIDGLDESAPARPELERLLTAAENASVQITLDLHELDEALDDADDQPSADD